MLNRCLHLLDSFPKIRYHFNNGCSKLSRFFVDVIYIIPILYELSYKDYILNIFTRKRGHNSKRSVNKLSLALLT